MSQPMREPGTETIRAPGGVSAFARPVGISPSSVANAAAVPVDEVDAARARQYALLSTLLLRAPDARLLAALAALEVDASPLGVAHATLAEAARDADADRVGREFFDLFIGLGRGELLP